MESACIFSLGLSLLLSSISKTKQIKLAFAFLKNFETAFFRKIVATVHFCVMFANCRIFVFSSAFEKVSGCATLHRSHEKR